MDLGLERIHRLLRALAPRDSLHPLCEAFPVIHVAGTNGKGSICAYLSHMLQASGLRVGRYNSPHLLIPRDAIQINHQPISQENYDALYRYVQETDKAHKIEATSFETLTAVAFCYFAYGGVPSLSTATPTPFVDIAVIEVGVGGRLDATNVFSSPEVCVIASIGMDHGALLGNTVEKIALEKAGIIKTGVPVVVAPQRDGQAVYEVVESRAREIGASKMIRVEAAEWCDGKGEVEDHDLDFRTGGWARLKQGNPLKVWIPLLGDFQLENAAAAIAAIRVLKESDKWSSQISDETIKEGLRNTFWPGRLQWIEPDGNAIRTKMLIDGAHNPASALALRAYVEECVSVLSARSPSPPVCVHWIMAFTRGKDVSEMFDTLLAPFINAPQTRSTVSIVEYSPPEGMPWVSSTSSQEVRQQLLAYTNNRKGSTSTIEVNAFDARLQEALNWSSVYIMPPKKLRKRPVEDVSMTQVAASQAMAISLEAQANASVPVANEEMNGHHSIPNSSPSATAPSPASDITTANQQKYRSKFKKRLAISLTQKQAICRYQIEHPNARFQEINQALGLELERTTILKIVRDKDKWLNIDSSGSTGYKTCFRASRYAMINRATALWLQAEHPDFLRSFFVHGYNVLSMAALAAKRGPETTLSWPRDDKSLQSTELHYMQPPSNMNDNSESDHSSLLSSRCPLPSREYDENTAALQSLSEAAADAARQLIEDGRGEPSNFEHHAEALAMNAPETSEWIPPLPSHDFMVRTIPRKALEFAQMYNETSFKASAGWLESFRTKLDLDMLPEIAATLERLNTTSPPFYRVITPHNPESPSSFPHSPSIIMSSSAVSEVSTQAPVAHDHHPLQTSSFTREGVMKPGLSASVVPTVDRGVLQLVQDEFAHRSSMSTKRRRVDDITPALGDENEDVRDSDIMPGIAEEVEPLQSPQHLRHSLHVTEAEVQKTGDQTNSPKQLYQMLTGLISWVQHGPSDYEFEDRQGFLRQLDSLRAQVVQRNLAS
ncbi:folylpolyglutamate synthase [Actinomortierella wolfii]|nr:folylpolyglutamate synthase [Actinomortierella wolfii]